VECDIAAISTDSLPVHKAYLESTPQLHAVQFPIISDRNQQICRSYRVLDTKTGTAHRAVVYIDPKGIIQAKLVYPKEVGRNSAEILRLLQALQYNYKTGKGVPVNWTPEDARRDWYR
jgi:alkyl hydroperoxide reductase subunit AhpC